MEKEKEGWEEEKRMVEKRGKRMGRRMNFVVERLKSLGGGSEALG